jgi:N-acetylneuraminic acid mutarotase
MGTAFSEPSPRWGHFSAAVEGKLCVWGGRTKDFSSRKSELASSVHSFDPVLESWAENKTSGETPRELYLGACASAGHHLFTYGGYSGSERGGSLHQLDTKSWAWKQLSAAGPMEKTGSGMIVYDNKVIVFGGYGLPTHPTQPGSEFIKDSIYTDGRGWTNEVHTFDVKEGE